MDNDIINRIEIAAKAIGPINRDEVYMNPVDFNILFNYLNGQEKPYGFVYVNGIKIHSDPEIEQGGFLICSPRAFEIFKSLRGNCWLQTYQDRVTAAGVLYHAEIQEKERGNQARTF